MALHNSSKYNQKDEGSKMHKNHSNLRKTNFNVPVKHQMTNMDILPIIDKKHRFSKAQKVVKIPKIQIIQEDAVTVRHKMKENTVHWYRISLPYGNKYGKNYIVSTLQKFVHPTPFIPLVWITSGRKASFYVDNGNLAQKLQDLPKKIKYPDGYKMTIKIKRDLPNVVVNSTLKCKIKAALENRYNAYGKALDLSYFHRDPNFEKHFCALVKPKIFSTVVDVISENMPELEALKLDYNRLSRMNSIGKLIGEKLRNLRILHLGNNQIRNFSQIKSLKMLPIVELVLEGNPIYSNNNQQYVTYVRKCFPKVTKLDGIDLATVGNVVTDENETKELTSMNENVAYAFLKEYLTVFDSSCRKSLESAYLENAEFTVLDVQKKSETIHRGNQAIVSFLSEFPATMHDYRSISVEINNLNASSMVLTVTGMYMELNDERAIRPFYKKLNIVSYGVGFCISTEELKIMDAIQIEKNSPVQSLNPSVLDEEVKLQMVQLLAVKSKMNLKYSKICLEEGNWNFDQACQLFIQANTSGAIPPEAFIQ